MNIGICLCNTIDAFSVNSEKFKPLQEYFPTHIFSEIEDVEALETCVSTFDLLITWVFKKEWYQRTPRLKAIFTPAAGSEWIEHDPGYSIPVFHGTFHGPLMAETLCAMILFFNKQFSNAIVNQKHHQWNRNIYSTGKRLAAQTILFYGYGSIARCCASMLKKFGCTILAVKRSEPDLILDSDADQIIPPVQCQPFLGRADHIVSILPALESTTDIFNGQFFQYTNPNAYFYNLGRGNCCDEAALLWALDNNKISGAALDVFKTEPLPEDSALWTHPGVLIYPHASAINSDYISFYIAELKKTLSPYLL
jgi:phosphoglycerate dehydrogenase-like enzyme